MKYLLWSAAIISVLAILIVLNINWIGFALFQFYVTPGQDFSSKDVPPAPDYALAENWAALPEKTDGADRVPVHTAAIDTPETDNQQSAKADVFFIHPTTYISAESWNADLKNIDARNWVDELVMPAQASAFNACCRIYAPRYRQATVAAFHETNSNTQSALDLAYKDILRAFDHFLTHYNADRPFILAGHSQGAYHVNRLLKDRISGTPLREQMVAAYPIGFWLYSEQHKQELNDIPLCDAPGQVGCLATWNAVGPEFTAWEDTSDALCTNPLSWRNQGKNAGHEQNTGALTIEDGGRLVAGVADASCENGLTLVTELRKGLFDETPMTFGPGNYHLLDFSLFWKSLRDNAQAQVLAHEATSAKEDMSAK